MSTDDGWFSERTKTWIVSITMAILLSGLIWGYLTAQQWRADRLLQKQTLEIQTIEKIQPTVGE